MSARKVRPKKLLQRDMRAQGLSFEQSSDQVFSRQVKRKKPSEEKGPCQVRREEGERCQKSFKGRGGSVFELKKK